MLRILLCLSALHASLAAGEAALALSPAATPDLASLEARVGALEASSLKALRVKVEGYAQLRYDEQQYKVGSVNSPSSVSPLAVPLSVNTRGAYIKRAEVKLSGEVIPNLDWVLGYGFEEGKLKDIGTVWKGLPLMHGLAGYTWTLQTGQFRQKFGAEPQLGSAKLPFHERAIMYGGVHPFGALNLKMIGERVLGFHLIHSHDFEAWGYDWGWSLSNDGTDQSKGTNSLAGAFPGQTVDENPSLTGRLGFKAWGAKAGVSWQRNSKNSQFMASTPSAQAYDETLGLDLRFELADWLWIQGEWVAQQGINGDTGLLGREEGSSLALGFYPVGFHKRKDLEPTFRFERVVFISPSSGAWAPSAYCAATAGLNWNFGFGKTSVNYTAYGLDDNYGAIGQTSLFTLQDQFTF